MKKKLTLVTFAAAFAAMFGMNLDMATAQFGAGPRLGNQVQEPDSFRRVAADLNVGLPGRLWVSSNFADQGFGYTGSYLTVGGKARLFEDFLDGRWLTEGRLHHSIEDDGGFFANVGIERVFSVKPAGAEVVTGFWYDFDGDQQGNFGHDFSQLGVNAAIKTRRWDLVGNGYFPIGQRNYSSAATVGGTFFQGNNIVLQQGVDSALTGFDVTLRMRPKQMAFMNGTFEIGGYGYSSDLVNSFGGGRLRIGAQGRRGLILGAEINHDDRFRTTGALSLGYIFGAVGGSNSEYAGIGRDLEETNRNDHIVRFNRSVELAIDPFTGAAYNVVHVQDGAGAGGDGTAENPYDTLLSVQANSDVGDVIFVGEGGTLDGGIRLQDRQFLLGGGTEQIIDIQDGRRFRLGSDTGNSAVLTNTGGANVILMADDNIIRGVVVDATGATNGINTNGSNNGIVENTTVSGAAEYGIIASLSTGDWKYNNNTLTGNGIDGLHVRNALDPNLTFEVTGNVATGNGFDGIHFENFFADSIVFSDNNTSNNARHGLFVEDYLTPAGEIQVVSHTSDANAGTGVYFLRGDGNLSLLNSTITNNLQSGFQTDSWTNQTAGQSTFVGRDEGGATLISGNGVGAGANLQFDLNGPNLNQDILVTGLTLDNGGRGIQAGVNGANSVMNLDLIDLISISDNTGDGIRLNAEGGGILNANILSQGNLPLQISSNAEANGAGIFISTDGSNGVNASQVNAVIDNVNILMAGSTINSSGIEISSLNNSFVDVSLTNSNIEKLLTETFPTGGLLDNGIGIRMNFANNGNEDINRIYVQGTTITTDNGIFLNTAANTFTDFLIEESTVQAAGDRVTQRVSDAPFDGNDAAASAEDGFTEFGNRGIVIRADGNDGTALADNSTRVAIRDVLVQDFAGTVFGQGGDEEVSFGRLPGLVGQGNEALEGSGIDIATTGDASLLLSISEVRLLNNGAGYNNDEDNNNVFNNQPVTVTEAPGELYFFDALKINAFDTSLISARISNNFFQDNFERAIGIDTYDGATINATIENNAFENNDRGRDSNIIVGPSFFPDDPVSYSQAHDTADIEIINNEEFYYRPYEHVFIVNQDGVPVDAAGDALNADNVSALGQDNRASVIPGRANICVGLANNVFQTGADIRDFSTFGDLRVGLEGASNGIGFDTGNATLTNFGLCEQLVNNEEANFFALGFASPIH